MKETARETKWKRKRQESKREQREKAARKKMYCKIQETVQVRKSIKQAV
jgi:hypothetical protein